MMYYLGDNRIPSLGPATLCLDTPYSIRLLDSGWLIWISGLVAGSLAGRLSFERSTIYLFGLFFLKIYGLFFAYSNFITLHVFNTHHLIIKLIKNERETEFQLASIRTTSILAIQCYVIYCYFAQSWTLLWVLASTIDPFIHCCVVIYSPS